MNVKNFIIIDNNNTTFNLYDYQSDNYLLLVFFRGAWCNHCKKQLLDLNKHLADFNKLKIKILAISSDTKFNSSLLKNFLKLKFPVISDSGFKLINYFKIKTKYKNREVAKPAVFIISPKREVVYQYVGKEYDDRLLTVNLLQNIKQLPRGI